MAPPAFLSEHSLRGLVLFGLPFVSGEGEAARVSLGQLLRLLEDTRRPDRSGARSLAFRRAARDDVAMHAWQPSDTVAAQH